SLEAPARGASVTRHRHGASPVNQSRTTRSDYNRIGGKRPDFHRKEVLANATAANAVVVQDWPKEIPKFVLGDFAGRRPTPHLLVKRIQDLLACRSAREGRAFVQGAAEPPAIEKTFDRAVKRDAQSVQKVNHLGRPIRHFLDGRLVGQEVAAVNRVVKVLPLVVAGLAGQVVYAIDPAL